MLDFEFYAPTRILFGRNALEALPRQVEKTGAKNILIASYGDAGTKKPVDDVKAILEKNGIAYKEFSGIKPNPLLSKVFEGVELCKKEGIDFIIAIGGGSVIDTAKAMAAGAKLKEGEDLWQDYYVPKKRFTDGIPLGVVLTIPAAGSEASFGSAIKHDELCTKRYTGGEPSYPKFAILNPEYTTTLPPHHTAAGVFDIFAHLAERYFVNFPNVDFSDRMLEAGIRTVLNNAPILVEDPQNYDARAEIMWTGCVAHNRILEAGRTHGDFASHDISHEVEAHYNMSHGSVLAIIMPAWMKYVYKHNKEKFLQFAVRVFDVDIAFDRADSAIEEMIARVERFAHVMGLPTRLSDVGVDESQFEMLADRAMVGREFVGTGNGIILLGKKEIIDVYKLAL